MTDNIWLFHVDDIGHGNMELILHNGLCPNRHLKAHDSMEGTLEAWELDGDCGRDQLPVKVRGHVDRLSGLPVSSKLLGPSTTMSVNKRKLRNS